MSHCSLRPVCLFVAGVLVHRLLYSYVEITKGSVSLAASLSPPVRTPPKRLVGMLIS